MATLEEILEQLEQIDLQILKLLRDRASVFAGLDEDADFTELDGDIAAMWMEEAAELGLDDARAEKMAKVANGICKKRD